VKGTQHFASYVACLESVSTAPNKRHLVSVDTKVGREQQR